MRRWLKVRNLLLAAVAALAVYAFWWEPSGLRAVEHPIAINGLGNLRIAVIADLHAGSPYIGEDKVRRVVALANAAKPDLILLTGEYVAGARGGPPMPIEKTASLLSGLHAPRGVFAVIGNH